MSIRSLPQISAASVTISLSLWPLGCAYVDESTSDYADYTRARIIFMDYTGEAIDVSPRRDVRIEIQQTSPTSQGYTLRQPINDPFDISDLHPISMGQISVDLPRDTLVHVDGSDYRLDDLYDRTYKRFYSKKKLKSTSEDENGPIYDIEFYLLIKPSNWNASFDEWSTIEDKFPRLSSVLSRSYDLHIRIRDDSQSPTKIGRILNNEMWDLPPSLRSTSDGVRPDRRDWMLAKAGMLNVFSKMIMVNEECPGWVDSIIEGIDEILRVQADRIVARISDNQWPDLGDESVDPCFSREIIVTSGHKDNLQAVDDGNTIVIDGNTMKSFKTGDKNASLQITFGISASIVEGQERLFIDADLDEYGNKFLHFVMEFIPHRLAGTETDPFVIYTLLRGNQRNIGYKLTPVSRSGTLQTATRLSAYLMSVTRGHSTRRRGLPLW